jgi:hypothetical protein
MEANQSPERILSFLNGLGFGFTSEKGMIEHCRDGRNLLKVIIEVIKHFEPTYLRSILAIECHRISEDLDRHRESLPFISDVLVAREVFRATKFDLRLWDIMHPVSTASQSIQNSREMAILSHLYALWNWNRQIQISNEVALGRLKLLQREQRSLTEQ